MNTVATAQLSPRAARRPTKLLRGQLVREGAGVRNIVTVGTRELPDFDPFLLLAEFGGEQPEDYAGGFPDHPHRGFETLTYVLAGRLRHADSRGNTGQLGPGAMQRMKAGRGVLHAEMPDPTAGALRAFQLWLNLPARHKMDEPAHQDVAAEHVPRFERDGVTVRVLVGEAFDVASPIAGGATDLRFLDVALSAGSTLSVPLPRDHAALAYVHGGGALAAGERVSTETTVVFSAGDRVVVSAEQEGPARLLLLAARPIGEPIARQGPFVMNTREELHRAFADYRAGRFGT